MDKIILDFINEINKQEKYLVAMNKMLSNERDTYEIDNGLIINIMKLLNVLIYRKQINDKFNAKIEFGTVEVEAIEIEKRIDELRQMLKEQYNANVNINEDEVIINNVELNKFEAYKIFATYMELWKKQSTFLSSTYVNIISTTEKFFGNILSYIFRNNPRKFNKLTETISLSEIEQYESILEIKEKIIERNVEIITRKSFIEWLDFIKQQKISIDKNIDKSIKDKAYEAFLRRNIFVHNGGIINNTYLSNASPTTHSFIKGQRVMLDMDYISNTIKIFKKIFMLLAIDVWYAVKRKDSERGDLFVNLTYSLLSDEDYYSAELIADKYMSIDSSSETSKKYVYINKLIAQKNIGDNWEKFRKSLIKEDYSIYSNRLQMAKYALIDENETVSKLLKEMIINQEITAFEICAFPLLKQFRESEYFSSLLDEYTNIQSFYTDIFNQKEKEGMIVDDLFFSLFADGSEED